MTMNDRSTHPSEGSLQALADGELEPDRAVDVQRHLRGCEDCARHLDQLRALGDEVTAALESLDGREDPERWMPDRAWETIRARRLDLRAHPRPQAARWWQHGAAAAIVVLLLGTGAAAALPWSPLRTWLSGHGTAEVLAPSSDTSPTEASPGSLPQPDPVGLTVDLRDGEMDLEVEALAEDGWIEIGRVDAAGVSAQAPMGTAFHSGPGRLRLVATGQPDQGPIRITLPLAVRRTVLRIDGQVAAVWTPAGLVLHEPVQADSVGGVLRLRRHP